MKVQVAWLCSHSWEAEKPKWKPKECPFSGTVSCPLHQSFQSFGEPSFITQQLHENMWATPSLAKATSTWKTLLSTILRVKALFIAMWNLDKEGGIKNHPIAKTVWSPTYEKNIMIWVLLNQSDSRLSYPCLITSSTEQSIQASAHKYCFGAHRHCVHSLLWSHRGAARQIKLSSTKM